MYQRRRLLQLPIYLKIHVTYKSISQWHGASIRMFPRKVKSYTYKYQTNTAIIEDTLKSQITQRVGVMVLTKALLDMKN